MFSKELKEYLIYQQQKSSKVQDGFINTCSTSIDYLQVRILKEDKEKLLKFVLMKYLGTPINYLVDYKEFCFVYRYANDTNWIFLTKYKENPIFVYFIINEDLQQYSPSYSFSICGFNQAINEPMLSVMGLKYYLEKSLLASPSLSEIWKKILENIVPNSTGCLMRAHCQLMRLTENEAHISVKSERIAQMVAQRTNYFQVAYKKVYGVDINVRLYLAEQR